METIIEQLLQSPKLSMYVDELQKTLADERQRRRDFYNDISEDQKAEFINGEVVIHSPVAKRHSRITGLLFQLMNSYVNRHDAGFVGIEKIMITLSRNDYEPDICYFRTEKSQHFTEDQKLFPAPDLIVEVLSESTAKKDRGVKFEDYAAHGVSEYWIIDPVSAVVEQYQLLEGQYVLILKSDNGNITSRALPGFSVPVTAIFNEKINLTVLTQILQITNNE